MSAAIPLSDSAKGDLKARIDAARLAHGAALAKNDIPTAQQHWNEMVSLIEVQMGRVEKPGQLTPEVKP